jgi:hypothetical protein
MASLGVSTLYVKTFIYWNASNITKSGHEPMNSVKPHPEESISWPELGPRDDVAIDGQLMPEGHVFEAQGFVGPEVRHDVSH